MLPSGIYAWEISELSDLAPKSFQKAFAENSAIDFLLLGTGDRHNAPPEQIAAAFEKADIGLEIMSTGAACRTYNVLLGEDRAVAAALIAVD